MWGTDDDQASIVLVEAKTIKRCVYEIMNLYHHVIHDHRVGGLYSPLFNIKKDAILIKVVQEVGPEKIDISYKPY